MGPGGDALRLQSEPAEHFQGAEIEVAGARIPRQVGATLDQHRRNPLLVKQEREREAGPAGAHDQNQCVVFLTSLHAFLLLRALAPMPAAAFFFNLA